MKGQVMKNLAFRLVVLGIVTAACGPAPPPSGGAAQPPAQTAAPASAAADNVKLTIVMARNFGHSDPKVTAACTGTVTTFRVPAERKHRVRWKIVNDDDNPCPNLATADVSVKFDAPTMSAGRDTSDPVLSEVKAQGSQIRAYVHADVTKVPNSERKYVVWYKNQQASPDPELDIEGDCGDCSPGGGS
jgi:hypothetical protein